MSDEKSDSLILAELRVIQTRLESVDRQLTELKHDTKSQTDSVLATVKEKNDLIGLSIAGMSLIAKQITQMDDAQNVLIKLNERIWELKEEKEGPKEPEPKSPE